MELCMSKRDTEHLPSKNCNMLCCWHHAPRTSNHCHIFHLPFADQTVKLLDKLRAGETNCGRSTTAADANQSHHGHYCFLCHTTECYQLPKQQCAMLHANLTRHTPSINQRTTNPHVSVGRATRRSGATFHANKRWCRHTEDLRSHMPPSGETVPCMDPPSNPNPAHPPLLAPHMMHLTVTPALGQKLDTTRHSNGKALKLGIHKASCSIICKHSYSSRHQQPTPAVTNTKLPSAAQAAFIWMPLISYSRSRRGWSPLL